MATGGSGVQGPILKDKNWAHWRKVMYTLLARENVWGVVGGTEELATDADANARTAFEKKQLKASHLVTQAISEKLMRFLPNEPSDPRVIWTALTNHFESKSAFNVFHLQNKLIHLFLHEGNDPGPWLQECAELYDSLSVLGEPVSDRNQCMATLAMLPPSYHALVTSLTTQLAQGALTMSQLDEFIENYRKSTGRAGRASSTRAEGGIQDLAYDEESYTAHSGRNKAVSRGRSPNRRHSRGRGGRFRSRGGRGGGSKQIECFGCGGIGHFKRDCPSEQHEAADGAVDHSEAARDRTGFALLTSATVLQSGVKPATDRVVIDSGATSHMTGLGGALEDFQQLEPHVSVQLGDGYVVEETGKGTLPLTLQGTNHRKCPWMYNCLYVPELACTLFSVRATTADCWRSVTFGKRRVWIKDSDDRFITTGTLKDKAFILDCKLPTGRGNRDTNLTPRQSEHIANKRVCCRADISADDAPGGGRQYAGLARTAVSAEVWDRWSGHPGRRRIKPQMSSDLVTDRCVSSFDLSVCEPRAGSRAELPYPNSSQSRSWDALELIHVAVCDFVGGRRQFVTFIDDKTRFVWIRFLNQKSQVFSRFRKLLEEVETLMGKKVKAVRFDSGGERISRKFQQFLANRGIKQAIARDLSQQSGLAEQLNQVLMEKARVMLHQSDLPSSFWAEALTNATYIQNRSPIVALSNKTPFEAWWGMKPFINHLRVFGSPCYSLVSKQKCRKAEKCLFLGYSTCSKAYRLYSVQHKIVVVRRNVAFNETAVSSEGVSEKGARQLIEVENDQEGARPEGKINQDIGSEGANSNSDQEEETKETSEEDRQTKSMSRLGAVSHGSPTGVIPGRSPACAGNSNVGVRESRSRQDAKKSPTPEKRSGKRFCSGCGIGRHSIKSDRCPARGRKCHKCHLFNHFARCCHEATRSEAEEQNTNHRKKNRPRRGQQSDHQGSEQQSAIPGGQCAEKSLYASAQKQLEACKKPEGGEMGHFMSIVCYPCRKIHCSNWLLTSSPNR